jgi:23S rRNA G2445 N2-methylase RlmL
LLWLDATRRGIVSSKASRFQQRAFADIAVRRILTALSSSIRPMASDSASVPAVYRAPGATLKQKFARGQAAEFTGKPVCGRYFGLNADKVNKLYNGCVALRTDAL